MTETFHHHGHTIEVTPRKIGTKRWTWSYTIDGRHFKENSEDFAPDAWTAATEGRDHARGAIERMPK